MDKYNIDIDHVIMHHMVNGKPCPLMWSRDENALKGWYDFIEKVKNAEVVLKNEPSSTNVTTPKPAPVS
jgi:N-acetylmuramoyl-L-alanine amidase CwlA